MKLTEKFTSEQLTALEALEEMFGPTKIEASEVSKHYASQYAPYALENLVAALKNFARAKMAETIDYAEIERLQQEERARKLAERSAEVRGNIVMGVFTGLLAKLQKTMPLGKVSFSVNDEFLDLSCLHPSGEFLLAVVYNKKNFLLTTHLYEGMYEDDATFVKGSVPFRDQFAGIEAIFSHLEGVG